MTNAPCLNRGITQKNKIMSGNFQWNAACCSAKTLKGKKQNIIGDMMEGNKMKLKDYQTELLNAAEKAMEKAYNPYSNFYVGAALLTTDDKIITGANYENASYGNTMCAERSALLRANAEGYRKFKAIAIIARGENFDMDQPISPCGACRQSLFEASQISDVDIEVIMSNTKKDTVIIKKISELLPYAFGPLDLGVNIEKYKRV